MDVFVTERDEWGEGVWGSLSEKSLQNALLKEKYVNEYDKFFDAVA